MRLLLVHAASPGIPRVVSGGQHAASCIEGGRGAVVEDEGNKVKTSCGCPCEEKLEPCLPWNGTASASCRGGRKKGGNDDGRGPRTSIKKTKKKKEKQHNLGPCRTQLPFLNVSPGQDLYELMSCAKREDNR